MLKKFKNKKGKNKGFTLLELMAVISIIGIMTSVGLVSLSSSRKDMLLKTSQDEVISAIKLAQSYALQGKVVSDASSVCGFGFKFTTDTEYEIFYYNTASSDCVGDKNEEHLERQELKSGVKLTAPVDVNNSKIYFSLPSAKVTASGAFPRTLEFNSEKTVTINSFGLVIKN